METELTELTPAVVEAELVEDDPRDYSIAEQRESLCVSANALFSDLQKTELQMLSLAQKNIFYTLQLGYFLTRLKESCEHGDFKGFFSDAPKSLKISCSKNNRGCFLDFTYEMGRRYMATYKKASKNFGGEDALRWTAVLDGEKSLEEEEAQKLLEKASKGAETPRQMMLFYGVKKEDKKPESTEDEPLFKNRNDKGGVKKYEMTPEERLMAQSFTRDTRDLEIRNMMFDVHDYFVVQGKHKEASNKSLKLAVDTMLVAIEEIKKLNINE